MRAVARDRAEVERGGVAGCAGLVSEAVVGVLGDVAQCVDLVFHAPERVIGLVAVAPRGVAVHDRVAQDVERDVGFRGNRSLGGAYRAVDAVGGEIVRGGVVYRRGRVDRLRLPAERVVLV